MNEVSSFVHGSEKGCSDNKLNYPPFTPGKFILIISLWLTESNFPIYLEILACISQS